MSDYIKSPMNYTGSKYKLLNQILPLFPQNINTFYDIFGGGGTVSLNVNSEYVYLNDIVGYVINIFKELKGEDKEESLKKVKDTIKNFELSKTNREGFNNLRNYYNKGHREWYIFFTLTYYSFNYQYRFNNSHQYNSSFGVNVSHFSTVAENKFLKFMDRLNEINITIDNLDFRDVDYSQINEDDLVYFDPPYLITTATYNDGKRGFKGWNEKDDLDLMNLCDKLDEQGARFAMSNVIEHKGLKNEELIEWSKKYKVYYLNRNYNGCNYQNNNAKHKTVEVLIVNY